jgi:hypothetical protein
MKVLELIIRFLQSPFYFCGQLLAGVMWCIVSWVRFVFNGGEFIWYVNPSERNTINNIYKELKELRDENPS